MTPAPRGTKAWPKEAAWPSRTRHCAGAGPPATCAAAAAKAAFAALVTGEFPDPVEVTLPRGERPSFALAMTRKDESSATAGVVKDAGDDPDVTHGALICATVRVGAPGAGVTFRAGEGVGTVTRPGLPVPPGEPAINPVPRRMIRDAIAEVAAAAGRAADAEVEISIPGGEALAAKTLNGRLGIVGGLSILGTTGIVVPYSCSAWIHSIHCGIDVARAAGLTHIAGATGASSEAGVQKLYGLPEIALIDMGDFVGGMLKYLRRHPVPRVTIAGGVAKMTKLAQGLLDLHSKRGEVDLAELAKFAAADGGDARLCGAHRRPRTPPPKLSRWRKTKASRSATRWRRRRSTTAEGVIDGRDIAVEIVLFDRDAELVGRAPFNAEPATHAAPPRKRRR